MIVSQLAKNSEFTYGVHSGFLDALVKNNQASILGVEKTKVILRELDKAVMGSVRSLNNNLCLFRQGIAYSLPFIFNENNEICFLVYERTKTNPEGKLAKKLSLAPGGHIEGIDLDYHILLNGNKEPIVSQSIDFTQTLKQNLLREVTEEVIFGNDEYKEGSETLGNIACARSEPIGFVLDSKDDPSYIGNVHFGVIYTTPVGGADTGFTMKEIQNNGVSFCNKEELKFYVEVSCKDPEVSDEITLFEPWSEYIINKLDEIEAIIRENWMVGPDGKLLAIS